MLQCFLDVLLAVQLAYVEIHVAAQLVGLEGEKHLIEKVHHVVLVLFELSV